MAERHVRLTGKITDLIPKTDDKCFVTGAIVREGLSRLTDMTVEFVALKSLKLQDLVGQLMGVEVEDHLSDKKRNFSGICVSVECIGQLEHPDGTAYHYVAQVRHWLWMLTRGSENRIFQEKTTVQIIEEVFGDLGFSDFSKKLRETYEVRQYCVQYRETNYDFICRLMEEEGIYFYFDNAPGTGVTNKLILCDDKTGSHSKNPVQDELKFTGSGGKQTDAGDTVTDWTRGENVVTGKVTLNDFDMLTPKQDLKLVQQGTARTSHSHGSYEKYHYPGKFRKDKSRGERLARVMMQANEVSYQTKRGASNSRAVSVGYRFKLTDLDGENGEYLVTDAVHYIRPTDSIRVAPGRLDRDRAELQYPPELEDTDYVVTFGAIPNAVQFRAPLDTDWPEISGLHTAMVVGKKGEEIWTDEHGRIKVQFHWDRVGQSDENSSCWVRVATPWSGKGWGMVAIPRIGQEVVIQFEEGDPDRPICTGCMFNQETKPAFQYPDDATQLGIRTNSSKGGGGYNELMFEDKKDAEFMRVQAQKDHQFLIKNKSVVTIGQDAIDAGAHDDEGSLSEVIRNHVTRTIQEGNHYHTITKGDEEFKIESGSQLIEIKTDKTQKIEGKHEQTITGNYDTTVKSGDQVTSIDSGDQTTTVKSGDQTTTVKLGNITTKASAGKITMTAAQSIELTVGGSSIKIDPSGVTIKGPMIKVQGTAMAEVKAPLTTVKADAMLTLKGGITMIN